MSRCAFFLHYASTPKSANGNLELLATRRSLSLIWYFADWSNHQLRITDYHYSTASDEILSLSITK